ncbi:mCG1026374, partial [Mus musculus]
QKHFRGRGPGRGGSRQRNCRHSSPAAPKGPRYHTHQVVQLTCETESPGW